jgi:hypothetical protein
MVLDSIGRSRDDYTSLAVETLDQTKAHGGWPVFPEIRLPSSAVYVILLFKGDYADDAQCRGAQSSSAQVSADDSHWLSDLNRST